MYIEELKEEYITSGIAADIVRSIMDTELNRSAANMRTDVVDCCLDILTEIEKYKKHNMY